MSIDKRINYILKNYSERLWEHFLSEDSSFSNILDEQSLIVTLSESDPTPNKKALRWIVETYIRNGFKLEDLDRVKETLDLFFKHQNQLSSDKKNLLSYKTEPDLYNAVKEFSERYNRRIQQKR